MTFTVAFNYGGRAEIVDAVRALVDDGVPARKINKRAIGRTCTPPTCPTPTWSSARRASSGCPTS